MIPEKYVPSDGYGPVFNVPNPRYVSFLEDLAEKQAEALIKSCDFMDVKNHQAVCSVCWSATDEKLTHHPDCPVLQSEAYLKSIKEER
jgi:hypothetical protein